MASLAEQYPSSWAKIEQAGYVSLAKMAQRFSTPGLMDAALGYSSAAHKWNNGRLPGPGSERRAAAWLAEQNDLRPASAGSDMLLVVCPDGVSMKARRLLAVLGCEVEAL